MKLGLLVVDGVHAGQLIAVPGLFMLVGRGPQCHVRPTSSLVGERHCSLLQREDGFYLRDLDSKAGTFLNDRKLRGGEIEVRDGDLVRVGPLTFLVQIGADKEAPVLQATDDPPPPSVLLDPEPTAAAAVATDAELPTAVPTQEMPALEPVPEQVAAHDQAAGEASAAVPLPGVAEAPTTTVRRTRVTINGTAPVAAWHSAAPTRESSAEAAVSLAAAPIALAELPSTPAPAVASDRASDVEMLAAAALLDESEANSETACAPPGAVDAAIATSAKPDSVGIAGLTADEACLTLEEKVHLRALRKRHVENQEPQPEPAKQGNLKIVCPNCQARGALPWGRMNSLLCCAHCWHWYRVARGGVLTEVPAPKKFFKGALRFHQGAGQAKVVPVTMGGVERNRRTWSQTKRWRPRGFQLSKEAVVLLFLSAYLFGIFALCYLQYASPSVARRAPPPMLSQ